MSRIRLFAGVFGRIFSILGLVFVLKALVENAPRLRELDYSRSLPAVLVSGALFLFVQILINSWIWRRLLGTEGTRLRVADAFVIYAQSQIAKYIPGNVFQYVDRSAKALISGVPVGASVGATTLEILLASGAAALLGSWAIFVGPAGEALEKAGFPRARVTAVALLVIGLLLVVVVRIYGERMRAVFSQVTPGTMITAFLLYLGHFIGFGVLIQFLARDLFGEIPVSLLELTTGFSLGWVVGFVVPGAPGGIGVREFVLQQIFGGSLGPAQAALLFLLIRLLGVFAEVSAFLLATAIKNRRSFR